MRERLMTAETAFRENGHLVLRDATGIARWTSNPADKEASNPEEQRFNINNVRLANLQRLILYRHGGPVDTDDASAYVSVAFNAIALARRQRGWKQSTSPLFNWAREWILLADWPAVERLAEKVVARPRKMTARTAGKLVRLTASEWEALQIKTIDPADLPAAVIAAKKARRKRLRDKKAKETARRESGRRKLEDIRATSRREFCERHGLSERSFYRHQQAGDLNAWLAAKGIEEKWRMDVATLERRNPILMLRHSSATASKCATEARRRRPSEAARREPEATEPTTAEAVETTRLKIAELFPECRRRAGRARLYEIAAKILAVHPKAAGRRHP